MLSTKPRIVIIGAGMAGLTAANKLYTSPNSNFDISVVEGGNRIGGRVHTSHFSNSRIEHGATWIHGTQGSPIYNIALQSNLLHSDQPEEFKSGYPEKCVTVAEGGHELNENAVEPVSRVFKNLLSFIHGEEVDRDEVISKVLSACKGIDSLSVGSFLRKGLEVYLDVTKNREEVKIGNWSGRLLGEAIFGMHEDMQRCFSAADDLCDLDYVADGKYSENVFPGEDVVIGRGYSSVVECLASVLPEGVVQLGRRVVKIEWGLEGREGGQVDGNRPVKLCFNDGSVMLADHVIVTVSLGVLKRGIGENEGLFDPPLPCSKIHAISRLGFGVVNKVYLQHDDSIKFPLLKMVFHKPDSEMKNPDIPNWIRKAAVLYPLYDGTRIVMSWFAGKEALELESLSEQEIIDGFSTTVSNLVSGSETFTKKRVKFEKALTSKWGSDPLFLGSYSYIAVGSSGDDMDTLAEPLPGNSNLNTSIPPLQILFAGEATHRIHYSNTHGAYLSGLREANRLLEHYNCIVV